MKRKSLIYALLASSIFAIGLSSCGAANNSTSANTTSVASQSETPSISSSSNAPSISSSSEAPIASSSSSKPKVYNLQDDELTQKVFNEFKKSFPNIDYDEFRENGILIKTSYQNKFSYMSSTIVLELDKTFYTKTILLDNVETTYYFRNGEWFDALKIEYTVNNGKRVSNIKYEKNNGEWLKASETVYDENENPIYTLDNWHDRKYDFTYDDKGNMLTQISYFHWNDTWMNNRKDEYTYDDKGNMITDIEFSYDFDNSTWYADTKVEWTYDSKGNELSSTVSYCRNNEWFYNDRYEETYNDNNRILTEIYSNYVNDKWEYIDKTEYTYDGDKRITETDLVYSEDGWKYTRKEEYTYDESDIRLDRTISKYVNNTWIVTDFEKYINRVITPIYNYRLDSEGTIIHKDEYTYDSDWNLIVNNEYTLIDNSWLKTAEYRRINGDLKVILWTSFKDDDTFEEKEEYTYDDEGKLLSELHYFYYNNEWLKSLEKRYVDGKEFELFSMYIDEGKPVNKTEKTYDDSGLEILDLIFNFKDGEWVNFRREEYTYDESGNCLTITYYDYIDGEWVLIYYHNSESMSD